MANSTTISANIFSKCSAALSVDSSRCDAITGLDVATLNPSDLASIYKDGSAWRVLNPLIEADFAGRACFQRTNGIYDWLMATKKVSSPKRMSVQQINGGLNELAPFVKMSRKGPMNNEYWSFASGAANTGNTPNGYPDTEATYKGDVTSQGGMPLDVRWFPRGLRVYITAVSSGVTSHTQYRVVDAAIVSSVIRLYLASENANVIGPAAKHTAPVTGLLTRGTPNVNDYEKYCAQIPGLNTKQLVPFWVETTRWSICEDDLYLRYMKAIKEGNAYFREFGDVESVELNRQITEDFQRREANSFFWNKPYANQTLEDYGSLEQITIADGDADSNSFWAGGKFIGRRAAATGIYWQHMECNRVKDLLGQRLNLPELFNALYEMQRVRKANGLNGNVFELFTDQQFALKLQSALLKYFKVRGEGILNLNYEMSKSFEQGPFGFRWTKFMLDYPQCELRIVTHDFFDDNVAAHKAASSTLETPGRVLWILDGSVNYQMIFEANALSLQNGGDVKRLAETDSSYLCVMRVPQKRQKLFSKMYTNVCECPQSSLFLENFSDDVPEHEYSVNSPTDLYGDYAGN